MNRELAAELAADAAGIEAAKVTDEKLAMVSQLAGRQLELESEIAEVTAKLKGLNEELYKVSSEDLPKAMEICGLKFFGLTNGAIVRIKEVVEASIPSETAIKQAKGQDKVEMMERATKCFAWLRDHGYRDLIKRALSMEFGRGEDKIAETTKAALRGLGLVVADKETVHPSTLKAFVKERLEAGDEFPTDLFKVHTGNVAKIERAEA